MFQLLVKISKALDHPKTMNSCWNPYDYNKKPWVTFMGWAMWFIQFKSIIYLPCAGPGARSTKQNKKTLISSC